MKKNVSAFRFLDHCISEMVQDQIRVVLDTNFSKMA